MSPVTSSPSQTKSLLIAVVVAFVLGLVFHLVIQMERQRLEQLLRLQVSQEAAARLFSLEAELNANIFLATGFAAYVEALHEVEQDTISGALAALYRLGRHVKHLGAAPDNRLMYLYPSQGNEAARGLYYPDSSSQWPVVKRAIDERRTLVTGPMLLEQGGTRVVIRTPIFLRNGAYWGLLSIVLDSDALFSAVDLGPEVGGIHYALSNVTSGAGQRLIFGQPALFEDDAVRLLLNIPGTRWELAAIPVKGWSSASGHLVAILWLNWLLAGFVGVGIWRYMRNRDTFELKLKHLAETDALTGLYNRRAFVQLADQLVHDEPNAQWSMLLIDIDHFKHVNDTYGHQVGDRALVALASQLQAVISEKGCVARFGGEEFAILLPHHSLPDAEYWAGQLLTSIRNGIIEVPSGQASSLKLTISIGVASGRVGTLNFDHLVRAADDALYRAKDAGRDQYKLACSC